MAVTKTLFRAIAPGSASVAEAVGRMNQELARDNERAMFVTAFAARLDLGTGELEYVNAGHSPTYRIAARGGVSTLPGLVDPALGAVDGHEYRAQRLRLEPRDALLLYTDGVVEARSAAEEEFHTLRLEGYLSSCRDVPARQMVHGLLDRLEEFTGDAPQYDDVTILALRWLSSAG
jgi:sigma-B regulation protein RsbU (phosphoserine phosphatase)